MCPWQHPGIVCPAGLGPLCGEIFTQRRGPLESRPVPVCPRSSPAWLPGCQTCHFQILISFYSLSELHHTSSSLVPVKEIAFLCPYTYAQTPQRRAQGSAFPACHSSATSSFSDQREMTSSLCKAVMTSALLASPAEGSLHSRVTRVQNMHPQRALFWWVTVSCRD